MDPPSGGGDRRRGVSSVQSIQQGERNGSQVTEEGITLRNDTMTHSDTCTFEAEKLKAGVGTWLDPRHAAHTTYLSPY